MTDEASGRNDEDHNEVYVPMQETDARRHPPQHLESAPPFTTKKRAGIFGTASNLVNTIVGAGIIGMPYAVRQSGLIAGVALIILVGFLTDRSLNMLVQTAALNSHLKDQGVSTYEDCMYYPYGLWGRGFILLGMFTVAFGAMVAYFIIIKDTIPTVIGFDDGFQRELVLIITSLVIILPLSMMRDMASLAVTSLLSVTCDIVLVFFVVFYSPVGENVSEQGGIGVVLTSDAINPNIFVGLGILSTAMCCQHSSFIIFSSLENNTRRRWTIVSAVSISISTFLCLILGISGYLGFGAETQGDVLNNFPEGSMEANVARALLATTMFFTYPMESFVGRHVLVDLIHNGEIECPISQRQDRGEGTYLDRVLLNRRERMTLALYILTLIPALVFDDLGPVLSVTGAVGGSCLAYIGPGLVYLGVNSSEFLEFCSNFLGYNDSGTIKLPIDGDANCVMSQEGTQKTSSSQIDAEACRDGNEAKNVISGCGSKPIWWYLFGFSIWYRIAFCASEGMKKHLAKKKLDIDDWEESSQLSNCTEHEELPPPTKWDFALALFMIVFGTTALLLGLGTNVYVQLKQVND